MYVGLLVTFIEVQVHIFTLATVYGMYNDSFNSEAYLVTLTVKDFYHTGLQISKCSRKVYFLHALWLL